MRLLIVGLLALAASGCGRDEFPIGWLDATGGSLDLTYTHGGGQELGDVDVEEHEDRVVVTLRDSCVVSCDVDEAAIFACVRVVLNEPLGSRRLIDGSTGRPPESHPPGRPRPPGIACEPSP
jgi:hypothetical protein